MAEGRISPVIEARNVLKKYKLNSLPIDVEGLCEELGIDVQDEDFSSIEGRVDKEISGAIWKRGNKYTILVNENEPWDRARFTIAHELGHYFLHVKNDPREIIASFRRDTSPRETEANKFAAELLMPRRMVEEEYNSMVIPVSDTLAKKFRVSKSAMRVRLDSLNLSYI